MPVVFAYRHTPRLLVGAGAWSPAHPPRVFAGAPERPHEQARTRIGAHERSVRRTPESGRPGGPVSPGRAAARPGWRTPGHPDYGEPALSGLKRSIDRLR